MNTSLKTIVWRTVVAAAIVILIAGCFYAEENARGLRAWRNAEREITARGESLNWDDYIPQPVPDDQNFFTAPMMTEWFVRSTNGTPATSFSTVMANPESTTNFISESAASNYLAWSAAFDPQFSQIREALKRPAARLNGDYSKTFTVPTPNFVNYRVVSLVLVHRAKCHLLLGQPDQALDDLTLLHHLNLTLVKSGRPGVLVSAMIHTAIAGIYTDAIAYGLDSHSWREPELAALQRQLAEIHLLPAVAGALQADRAGMCHLLDVLTIDAILKKTSSRSTASDFSWWVLLPSGWVYQNKAVIATLDERMITSVNFTNQTVSPYKAKAAALSVEQNLRHVTPYNYIAAMVTPNFSKAMATMARNQTRVDQAQIVCALERCRLANGKYPTDLAALVPPFLEKIPQDIITGKPMCYLRKDEQNFALYSVGWNEVDDGGTTARHNDNTEDRDNGDWVWGVPSQ